MSDKSKTGLYSDGTGAPFQLEPSMAFLHRLLSMAEHGDELFKLIPEKKRKSDEVQQLFGSFWAHVEVLQKMYDEMYAQAGYTLPKSKWKSCEPMTADEFLKKFGGDNG